VRIHQCASLGHDIVPSESVVFNLMLNQRVHIKSGWADDGQVSIAQAA
jgi:hypothetical protein